MKKNKSLNVNFRRRDFVKTVSVVTITGPLLTLPIEVLGKSQYNIAFWRTQTNGQLRITSAYAKALVSAPTTIGDLRVTQAYAKTLASAPPTYGELRATQIYAKTLASAPPTYGELRVTSSYVKVLVKM